MKKAAQWITFFLLAVLVFEPVLEARGGGRGGGGGGRGGRGGGGGRSVQRSPSMSRASQNRPAARPQNRPTAQRADRSLDRNRVQQSIRNNPNVNRSNIQGNRNFSNVQNRRNDIGRNVRDSVRDNRPGRNDWFNDRFWDNHNYHPDYYGHGNWWRAATAASLVGWLGWGGYPQYYDYGYSNGDYYWETSGDTTSAPSYSQQTAAIESTPTPSSSNEWMPLGVFALSKDSETTTTPTIYFQLALDRKGVISGTAYNSSSDTLHEVTGLVDEKTQRAAWKVLGKENAPILETGLYNLTQGEAPTLVHFDNGTTQQMLLVQIDKG